MHRKTYLFPLTFALSLFGSFCYGASATEPLQMPLEMIVTPSDLVINRPTHSSTAEADTETIIEPVIDSFAVEIDTANDTGSSIDRAISDRATADSTDVINSGVDSSTAEVNPTDTIEPVEPMHQVTEVTQLSDVNPTDWAFQALQSLVERYGCIVGYPDGTFRGERALSRYEFAAGLNACLERLSELLAATTADLVQQSDLETLQKLQEEFSAELATLRGRVDRLESRTVALESNQFSTTTRLVGEAIFVPNDAFGGRAGELTNTTLSYRVGLYFLSSFSGEDQLTIGLRSGNAANPSGDGQVFGFPLPGNVVNGILFPSAEGTLSSQYSGNLSDALTAITLEYQFPVNDRLQVYVGTGSEVFNQFADTLNPYFDDDDGGRGAISTFGQRNPLYRLAGGPGAGFNYQINDQLTFTGGYLAAFLNGASNPSQGLFNGSYAALAQLTWRLTKDVGIAATYINSYDTAGRFGFNNLSLTSTGTAVANTLAGQVSLLDAIGVEPFNNPPVIANSYGGQISFQPSPDFVINGWFGATYARLIGRGDGQILTYALNLGFPNLGGRGNLLGLVVGAEPYLTRFRGGNPQDFRVDVPIHIEGFYRWQLTPNISLTPGVIWLTAPNQDNRNDDTVIAVLRTTFNF